MNRSHTATCDEPKKPQAFAYHVLSRHCISWDRVTCLCGSAPFRMSLSRPLSTGRSGSLRRRDHACPSLRVFLTSHCRAAAAAARSTLTRPVGASAAATAARVRGATAPLLQTFWSEATGAVLSAPRGHAAVPLATTRGRPPALLRPGAFRPSAVCGVRSGASYHLTCNLHWSDSWKA